MRRFVVLLGPPGAGKGTQAKTVANKMGLPHISSGDIFRENIKNQTELGRIADEYMSKGELVPDDVTIAMIKERISRPDCANGALMDGFPRTPAQAIALEEVLKLVCGKVVLVPYITVPEGRETLPRHITQKAEGAPIPCIGRIQESRDAWQRRIGKYVKGAVFAGRR